LDMLLDAYRSPERLIYMALRTDKIDSPHLLTSILYNEQMNDIVKMLAVDRLLQKNIENKNDIIMNWLRNYLGIREELYSSQLIKYTMIALKAYSPEGSIDFLNKLLDEFKYNKDVVSGIAIALSLFNDKDGVSFYLNNRDVFDCCLYDNDRVPKMITM
ncbi:MAG: hypothetical protein NZM04_06105, partial [Methylacidiphilales bacterium]|nr:hypothetical protein [Candidatus Methylacidiphilales bacterium]